MALLYLTISLSRATLQALSDNPNIEQNEESKRHELYPLEGDELAQAGS